MAYQTSISLSPFEWLERAETFWRYHKTSPTKPRYFLLRYAIRLVLTAYITSCRSLTEGELKKTFEQDLIKLLDEARRLGLTISPLTESEIEKLMEAHFHFAQYPNEATNRALVFEHFCGDLFEVVRSKIVTDRIAPAAISSAHQLTTGRFL